MSDAVTPNQQDPQDQNRVAVVVPLDGSELAERALPLAKAFLPANGELVLVQVLPGPSALTELATADLLTPVELDEDQNAEARADMEAVVERLRGEGLAARALVLEGDPVHEITRVAAELEAELIVMATHGRGALQRLAHGSVADGVSRHAATPVLLVRVRNMKDHDLADAPVRRLVVPHDGSETAAEAVPVAVRHARTLGVPVLLVRAVNPSGDVPMAFTPAGGPDAVSAAVYEEVLEDEEDAATASLDTVKAEIAGQGVTVTSEVMVGTAVAVIGELHAPGDVVVMSSHGRSGIGRWLLGSVAEKLVREGTAPVIVVPAADRVAAHEAQR
jgi:nucleotide-binding universal stress UspA family protein